MNQSAPKPAGFEKELELPNGRSDSGARSDAGVRGDAAVRGDIVSHTLRRISDSSPLDRAITEARDALIASSTNKATGCTSSRRTAPSPPNTS